MPGGDPLGPDGARAANERAELHQRVAAHARGRRAPGGIIVGEWLNDVTAELFLEIDHVVREPEPVGHLTRIAEILGRATATVALFGAGEAVDQLHRETHDRT